MMADFLRRMGVCEELGTGVDKAITAVEDYQLRAPVFETRTVHTKVTLYAS
jgi:predicted HTH transcriptional regulator